MDYTKEYVSKAIKRYRAAHNLSQIDLAVKLETSQTQILRWEKAKTLPHKLALKALKEYKILD